MTRLKRHPESRSAIFKISLSLAALAIILVGISVWLVFFTAVFRIERVVVRGNRYLDEATVLAGSGVGSYENLVTLPAEKISRKLEAEPWVESARIRRVFFHTVVIELTERDPVALLDCNGAGFLLDRNAVAIAGAGLESLPSLPRIHGGDISTPRPGIRVGDRKVSECVRILGGMAPSLRGEISMANPFDGRGQVFVARDGFQVIYGSAEESSRKNELLEAVMVDMRENGRSAEYVDLRVPDSPATKLK